MGGLQNPMTSEHVLVATIGLPSSTVDRGSRFGFPSAGGTIVLAFYYEAHECRHDSVDTYLSSSASMIDLPS